MRTELKPHQQDALKRLKNGSILWGGVGSGKSKVAIAYYMEKEAPRNIYVITTAKKRDSKDWILEAAHFGIGQSDGESLAGLITVDSWNNIDKYKEIHGAFFIFDEQRVVGRGKWVKAFLRIARRNRWILLSATPGDTWLDYVPVFVANGFYESRRDFEFEHVVWTPYLKYPKVQRFIGLSKLHKIRNEILVHMRYSNETVRHSKTIWCDYDVEKWEIITKKRWNPWADKPIRDASELFALMRMVVNSHPSRLEAVETLLRAHPRLIVFYNFNYELEALRGLKGAVDTAEWNGWKHEEIPDTEKWLYLVQYVAGSEGWNCISTDSMCFYSMTPSYKKWEQSHGRIDRMNTPFMDLFYFTLRSNTPIDTGIWRALKQKKDFNINDFDLKMLDWN